MDYDNDGVLERIVKFNRAEIQNILSPGTHELKITGKLYDGTLFEGSDMIRVI